MPPTSTIRKAPPSTSTTTPTTTFAAAESSSATRRTHSGRAVRANTTRPTNYYARPFASNNVHPPAEDDDDGTPAGFFPAITFFTDAITALPKEVMRQLTLMKEVEAKIHGNNEKLAEVVGEVLEEPVPPRETAMVRDGVGEGVLSLTANNSVVGSAAASLVNGVAPTQLQQISAQNSVAGSLAGEDTVQNEEELARRQKYHDLRSLIAAMLPNLDEKGVVLSEANRILQRQHLRIESVWPHLSEELSDEARYGSMTHWAYSDNRVRKQTAAGAAVNRRDLAGTNNLAAAAHAMQEHDIATARREAMREGKQKGRGREQVDSDFDERPRKTQSKVVKSKPAAGLGISSANGEAVVKRRKVEKAPAMERSISTTIKNAKKEAQGSTPLAEGSRKAKTRPPMPMKRKGITSSAQNSPALASSPLHSSFTGAKVEPPSNNGTRPATSRMRTGSSATTTNLRHERIAGTEQQVRSSSRRKVEDLTTDLSSNIAKKSTETSDGQARVPPTSDSTRPPAASRSGSNSNKVSAANTPRTESFPEGALQRTWSTRSIMRDGGEKGSSSEPQTQGISGGRHMRMASNSHLVKQLASFNRSPDRNSDDDDDDKREEGEERSPRKRRTMSRRNTLQRGEDAGEGEVEMGGTGDEGAVEGILQERGGMEGSPTGMRTSRTPEVEGGSEHGGDTTLIDEAADGDVEASPRPASRSPSPQQSSPARDDEDQKNAIEHFSDQDQELDEEQPDQLVHSSLASDVDDEDEEEEGDPDDPNEPKYCYCNRGSYGEMIACDNEGCAREWFHLGCTGLREAPGEEEKWFCVECAPLFTSTGNGNGRGRGGGRGKGRGRG